jgi:hypothetical protein
VHPEFYCRPHAEGAEDTENRSALLRVLRCVRRSLTSLVN